MPPGAAWYHRFTSIQAGQLAAQRDAEQFLVLSRGFSSVNQLVSASRAAVHSCDGLEMRAVLLGSKPTNSMP